MLLFTAAMAEWALVLAFTVWMLYRHASPEVTWLVRGLTFVGWFLGFSIIAILPLDIFIVSGGWGT